MIRLAPYILFSFFISCSLIKALEYAIGADLSFMKQAEDNGFVFKEDRKAKPCLEIFKEHGLIKINHPV